MDSLVLGPWDVGDTANINFRKVDSVVPDGWWCWRWIGGTFIGFWILSEEITYNSTPPHFLEFIDNTFIKPFLSDLSGLLFAVDGIRKIRNKTLDFVDKWTFFWNRLVDNVGIYFGNSF